MGSVNNGFATKEQLLEAAIEVVLDGSVHCSTT
jgi:hypothetical protein